MSNAWLGQSGGVSELVSYGTMAHDRCGSMLQNSMGLATAYHGAKTIAFREEHRVVLPCCSHARLARLNTRLISLCHEIWER